MDNRPNNFNIRYPAEYPAQPSFFCRIDGIMTQIKEFATNFRNLSTIMVYKINITNSYHLMISRILDKHSRVFYISFISVSLLVFSFFFQLRTVCVFLCVYNYKYLNPGTIAWSTKLQKKNYWAVLQADGSLYVTFVLGVIFSSISFLCKIGNVREKVISAECVKTRTGPERQIIKTWIG